MRRLNRLLVLLIGLAVAAVAVITGIEIVELAAGHSALLIPRHAWDQDLRRQHWGSFDIGLTSGILIAIGAVLVLPQLARRRPVRLALRAREGERVFVSRKGLARRIGHEVTRLEEVDSAKVKVARRAVRAKATLLPHHDRQAGEADIRTVIDRVLGQVAVVREMKVRVKVKVAVPPEQKKPSRLDQPSVPPSADSADAPSSPAPSPETAGASS